ncbi:hypothetical protein EIN_407550 [Entamoeba invadens IP1]|uniref:Serine/threonine-protein phosphatase 4 regulatory subunit 3-like central domain-containing protein n=1 Tax=Entamoeba invadens IP1 TaxID=370355 RepID=A0A0A1TWJ9_ENTIV|nr:hypothetical protein EIN_407550 [Entamoeba invadens IP1]ELP85556.1 hypothetical protein EIN_407550 [Entamoeba invadens IP1]|eukprot:XP_004184902.1 hypothetical protein EIN_407550 [Entamoeba invadens IP1]
MKQERHNRYRKLLLRNSLDKLLCDSDFIGALTMDDDLQQELCQADNLGILVNHICGNDENDFDDCDYQMVSTQIICSDMKVINESIAKMPELIETMILYINPDEEETLICIIKTFNMLLMTKNPAFFNIITKSDLRLEQIWTFVDNYDVFSFFVALLKQSGEEVSGLNWLCSNNFVGLMLNSFLDEIHRDVLYNEEVVDNITKLFEQLEMVETDTTPFLENFNACDLNAFYKGVFSTGNLYLKESGIKIIRIVMDSSHKEEMCNESVENLPPTFSEIFKFFTHIVGILQYVDGPITSLRIELARVVLSLVNSQYQSVVNKVAELHLVNELLNIFFCTTHSNTIFRQLIFEIVSVIYDKQMVEPLCIEIIKMGFLEKLLKYNKLFFDSKEVKNSDLHTFVRLFLDNFCAIQQNAPEGPVQQLLHNNTDFQEYYLKNKKDAKLEYFLLPKQAPTPDEALYDFNDENEQDYN